MEQTHNTTGANAVCCDANTGTALRAHEEMVSCNSSTAGCVGDASSEAADILPPCVEEESEDVQCSVAAPTVASFSPPALAANVHRTAPDSDGEGSEDEEDGGRSRRAWKGRQRHRADSDEDYTDNAADDDEAYSEEYDSDDDEGYDDDSSEEYVEGPRARRKGRGQRTVRRARATGTDRYFVSPSQVSQWVHGQARAESPRATSDADDESDDDYVEKTYKRRYVPKGTRGGRRQVSVEPAPPEPVARVSERLAGKRTNFKDYYDADEDEDEDEDYGSDEVSDEAAEDDTVKQEKAAPLRTIDKVLFFRLLHAPRPSAVEKSVEGAEQLPSTSSADGGSVAEDGRVIKNEGVSESTTVESPSTERRLFDGSDLKNVEFLVCNPDEVDWEEGVEYLVKWMDRSYLHCTWERYSTLATTGGFKKLQNFIKLKADELVDRLASSAEEREHLAISEEQEKERIAGHTRVERIVERRIVGAETESGAGTTAAGTGREQFFVLWHGLNYCDCTWEEREDIAAFADAIAEHDRFEALTQTRVLPRTHPTSYTPLQRQPASIVGGTLREYQLHGVNWLTYCFVQRSNGILADEMGLGKTVQTIAFLANIRERYQVSGPHIVVVPLSTLSNWYSEFRKWCPTFNVIAYTGNAKSREVLREHEFVGTRGSRLVIRFDVLLTTFETVMTDTEFLGQVRWFYMIVDEAHRLKNFDSKLYACLKQMSTQFRLLITGTPLQNTIRELWSLLHFLMPQKFASLDEFEQRYSSLSDQDKIGELHQLIKPHLLRRIKSDVEKDLPQKKELILRVAQTSLQRQYYRYIITRNLAALNEGVKGARRSTLLNVVVELKKLCNHPFLFASASARLDSSVAAGDKATRLDALVHASGKMVLLDKLLERLKETGHRVLIFSQMVRMLEILAEYLHLKGWKFQRLDGSTPREARQHAMDSFNEPGSKDFVFLLSTRAGGLGINLTSADTVVIFDSDWNPQNDLQAQARCHRIGQEKLVNIYRFVTKDTVEENILERAKHKMVLDHLVIQSLDADGKKQSGVDSMGSGKSTLATGPDSGSGADSLQKEELDRILKLNVTNIFADGGTTAEEENLDEILSRAETFETTETAAESLLSTFKVTTFKESDDDGFWSRVVRPDAEAAARDFERSHAKIIPRHSLSSSLESIAAEARTRSGRRDGFTGAARRSSGDGEWTEKEIRSLIFAMRKLGGVSKRMHEFVAKTATLGKKRAAEVDEVIAEILAVAESTVDEWQRAAAATSATTASAAQKDKGTRSPGEAKKGNSAEPQAAHDDDTDSDVDVDTDADDVVNDKDKCIAVYNGVDFDAADLMRQVTRMRELDTFMKMLRKKGLKALPFKVRRYRGDSSWHSEYDILLLNWIHQYGAGNWNEITSDPAYKKLATALAGKRMKSRVCGPRSRYLLNAIIKYNHSQDMSQSGKKGSANGSKSGKDSTTSSGKEESTRASSLDKRSKTASRRKDDSDEDILAESSSSSTVGDDDDEYDEDARSKKKKGRKEEKERRSSGKSHSSKHQASEKSHKRSREKEEDDNSKKRREEKRKETSKSRDEENRRKESIKKRAEKHKREESKHDSSRKEEEEESSRKKKHRSHRDESHSRSTGKDSLSNELTHLIGFGYDGRAKKKINYKEQEQNAYKDSDGNSRISKKRHHKR